MNTRSYTFSDHLIRGLAILIPAALIVIPFYMIRNVGIFALYLLYAYAVAVYFSAKTHLAKRWLHTFSVILTLFITYSAIISIKALFMSFSLQNVDWSWVLFHAIAVIMVTLLLFVVSWLVYWGLDILFCLPLKKKPVTT